MLGVNRPFLRYIARMPDGRCSATDGASVVDGSAFHCAADPEDTLARADEGTLVGSDVRLTAAGSELFNDVYPEGTPLDDLTVHPVPVLEDQ